MTNTKKGASSVVRPDNIDSTVLKLTGTIISKKFKFFKDKRDLYNEAYCAALKYINEKPKERLFLGLIYKRIYGALTDYVNNEASIVKITKNKQSKLCLYQKYNIDDKSTDGEKFVKNAKQSVELSEEIINKTVSENNCIQKKIEGRENELQFTNLALEIKEYVNENFCKRDKEIFEKRILNSLKLKEVSRDINMSSQRVNILEKNICNNLKSQFGTRFQDLMCNN